MLGLKKIAPAAGGGAAGVISMVDKNWRRLSTYIAAREEDMLLYSKILNGTHFWEEDKVGTIFKNQQSGRRSDC